MSYTRRLLIGATLAGTTSIATKKAVPASAEANGAGWTAVRKEARERAREAGESRLRLAVIGAGVSGSDIIQRLLGRERSAKDVEVVAVCEDVAAISKKASPGGAMRALRLADDPADLERLARFVERKPNPPVNQALSSWKALSTPQPVERSTKNMPAGV